MPGIGRLSQVMNGALCVLLLIVVSSTPVEGQGLSKQPGQHNLGELIGQSQRILLGRVESVTDGLLDDNIPYTEIRLSVTEALKGPVTSAYQFRQFGKLQARGGKRRLQYLEATPPGFPHWAEGETVLVFLPDPARMSGLHTTVGLAQGKLVQINGRFESEGGLQGIFNNLVVEAGDLTREQTEMLEGGQRAVKAAPLLDLVRRAVGENWVERGVMHREE